MKAKLIMVMIGTVLTGVACLVLAVIYAAMAISATSIDTTIWCSFISLIETGAVVSTAVQITKVVKKWF